MDTEIGYLRELREDLLDAVWRESLAAKKPKRSQRRRIVAAALAATAVLAVAAALIVFGRGEKVLVSGGPADMARSQKLEAENGNLEQHLNPSSNDGQATYDGPHSLQLQQGTDAIIYAPGDSGAGGGGAWAPEQTREVAAAPQALAGPEVNLAKIVKTASLSVVVPNSGFQDALGKADDVTARYGGYIQSSSTRGTRSGILTIRVPSEHFESALADLQALGNVERETSNGQDVTAQFVDLGARLKIAERREAVLMRLMGRAHGVSQILQLRNVLEEAQLNVEQLKGQLNVLQNRSSLGTITVALREQGVVTKSGAPTSSFASAIEHAVSGFLHVLFAIIVGLGYAIPIAALCIALWLVVRRVLRARRRSA